MCRKVKEMDIIKIISCCGCKNSLGTTIPISGNVWVNQKVLQFILLKLTMDRESNYLRLFIEFQMCLILAREYFKYCVNLDPKLFLRYLTQLHIWQKTPAVIAENSDSLFKYLFFIYQQIFPVEEMGAVEFQDLLTPP